MEEIARVYAEALFEVAKEKGKLDVIRDQLGPGRRRARERSRPRRVLLQPLLLSAEKRRDRARDRGRRAGADQLPRAAGREAPDARDLPHAPLRRDVGGGEPPARGDADCDIELDPEVVERVGAEIERQTDRKVQLRSQVDGDLLGGLVLQVGNMVLDASIRNRLEKRRKEVAQAA